MINWATSPHVKRLNMAFVLVDEKRADLSERLTSNPHVASIEVPLPAEPERVRFVNTTVDAATLARFSDYDAAQLASLTAGISLTDLNVIVQSAREGGRRLDSKVFRELKKLLIERQCHGLLEFIEPKWSLDTVVGHEAAKARLREDAALLKRGSLDSLPMGYLICGPVGTGKSFLAQCVSGEMGAPCVMLKNFRSKYVGETEGNLERVLSVLRAMGPVVVVIDEADAALGGRDQDGDSGTSSRVFGMIASQMGDTKYRGRIIWMLLTARPDLLPIDLKRQGRAEVHIPLFYPTDESGNPSDVRDPRKQDGIARLAGRHSGDSSAWTSFGSRHRGNGGPGVAQVAARRSGSHHARVAGRRRLAVHALDAGDGARAPGDCRRHRVHRPAVPSAADTRANGR